MSGLRRQESVFAISPFLICSVDGTVGFVFPTSDMELFGKFPFPQCLQPVTSVCQRKWKSVTRYTSHPLFRRMILRRLLGVGLHIREMTSQMFFLQELQQFVPPLLLFSPNSCNNPSFSPPVSRNNGVPPAPPQLSVLGATSSSITLSWNASSSSGPAANYDGGSPLLAYHLHYHREFGDWERVEVSQVLFMGILGNSIINRESEMHRYFSYLKKIYVTDDKYAQTYNV